MPQGATPRTLVVHLTGELTRTVKPGDPVTVSGVFLPEPFTGFRAAKAGLLTTTFLLAQRVQLDKQSYEALSHDAMQEDAIQVTMCPPPPPPAAAGDTLRGWSILNDWMTCRDTWCHLFTQVQISWSSALAPLGSGTIAITVARSHWYSRCGRRG